ncbi:MAG: L-seryl-tRNA(Ser) seleniumtransferase [Chloroflexi bacterium]|nr:MAG: L-seryl-tRNA(Ser) seleniumtransferase [Chloroflexota bacterium]
MAIWLRGTLSIVYPELNDNILAYFYKTRNPWVMLGVLEWSNPKGKMPMPTGYRNIPSVEKLLSNKRICRLVDEYSHEAVVHLVRSRLEEVRHGIADGDTSPSLDNLVEDMVKRAASLWSPWPRHVVNATGVILHTNLGRAPLSHEATEALLNAAEGYSNLELDLHDGVRGSRQAHIESILCQLTGAEASLVVNNNASAVLLGLAAIASKKEVIVSRGEAVEIGGGFRIPDVLRESGATLTEVGTTNRTYLADYEGAITHDTGALLKVHSSNFLITGFTHDAVMAELVEVGARHQIPVLHDLGSGCLVETTQFGLAHEPMAQESITAGADLVFFSGDKLLGGPQAGIIIGKKEKISMLARHPLARAMRIDKLNLAALTTTLLHYLRAEALDRIPVWRMVSMPIEELEATAHLWQKDVDGRGQVVPGLSTIGGGSLPGETLSTWLLALTTGGLLGGAQGLVSRLRKAEPPVVARIEEDRVVIDPRTVLPGEEDGLRSSLKSALEG